MADAAPNSEPESKTLLRVDLARDSTFWWYYNEHYDGGEYLPKYVDRDLFRKAMQDSFNKSYCYAVKNGGKGELGLDFTHPLMSEAIDPGASDNYETYFGDMPKLHVPALCLSLQQEWHELVKSDEKGAELRKGPKGKYDDIVGKLVVIALNGDDGRQSVMVRVDAVTYLDGLDDLCSEEGDWFEVTPQAEDAQQSKSLLLEIHKRNGKQVFSPEAIKEKGGLCVVYFHRVNPYQL